MPDTPGPWGQAQRDAWEAQWEALGAFIRERRKQANLSLRQLAELTSLSNPYLSQIERGLHQPSVRVLRAISDALNLSAETLLARAAPRRRPRPQGNRAGGRSANSFGVTSSFLQVTYGQNSAVVARAWPILRDFCVAGEQIAQKWHPDPVCGGNF